MLNYAICEIGGKQYKVFPGQELAVSGQADVVKVLLLSENGKIKVGKPYLKETLTLKILEQVKGPKVRVAKYHAKANYRKVTGYRKKFLKVELLT